VHTRPTAARIRADSRIPPTKRLCEKFVVRPSGGSLYLGFRLITNFRLKAELRTYCFHTVLKLVDCSYLAYNKARLGFYYGEGGRFPCRLGMNDPPTTLVGLAGT